MTRRFDVSIRRMDRDGVDFQNPNIPSFRDLPSAIDYINANTTPRASGYERWVVRLFELDGRKYTWTPVYEDRRGLA
jgi:hypothetical protein